MNVEVRSRTRLFEALGIGMVVPILIEVLGGVFFTLVAALKMDTHRHDLPANPSQDGAGVAWYLHWRRELSHHFLLLLCLSLSISVAVFLIRTRRSQMRIGIST